VAQLHTEVDAAQGMRFVEYTTRIILHHVRQPFMILVQLVFIGKTEQRNECQPVRVQQIVHSTNIELASDTVEAPFPIDRLARGLKCLVGVLWKWNILVVTKLVLLFMEL
jgi:hypothetical protein